MISKNSKMHGRNDRNDRNERNERNESNDVIVWINARFLSRPVTGVERVAHELISVLARHELDGLGCWSDGRTRYRFKLIAPKSVKLDSPWNNIKLERRGWFSGHIWEQLALPVLTRGGILLSLCNTGPLLKSRHVVFLHDAQPFAIPQNFSVRFRTWYRVLFKLLSRSARSVLVNSRFTFSELKKYVKLDSGKSFLCYLGCDHVHQHQGTDVDLEKFSLPNEGFVLAVSSNNPNKNFAAVVQALTSLGDDAPHCVIVGQQDQGHFGKARLDPGKVHHLGYVSDQELIALYRRAMCLVFPSFYEGFGLPPLEAMAVGCPVVVSNTSALKEIAKDGAAYCDPAEPRSLARAIMQIRNTPDYRATLIQNGRHRASKFSWQHAGKSVLQALSNLNDETMVRASKGINHALEGASDG